MIINHIDGSVTDTDKLPDATAEVMTAVKQLLDVCCKYKVPVFMRYIDPVKKSDSGIQNYNNSWEDFAALMNSINGFFAKCHETRNEPNIQIINLDMYSVIPKDQ